MPTKFLIGILPSELPCNGVLLGVSRVLPSSDLAA